MYGPICGDDWWIGLTESFGYDKKMHFHFLHYINWTIIITLLLLASFLPFFSFLFFFLVISASLVQWSGSSVINGTLYFNLFLYFSMVKFYVSKYWGATKTWNRYTQSHGAQQHKQIQQAIRSEEPNKFVYGSTIYLHPQKRNSHRIPFYLLCPPSG